MGLAWQTALLRVKQCFTLTVNLHSAITLRELYVSSAWQGHACHGSSSRTRLWLPNRKVAVAVLNSAGEC